MAAGKGLMNCDTLNLDNVVLLARMAISKAFYLPRTSWDRKVECILEILACTQNVREQYLCINMPWSAIQFHIIKQAYF